MMSKVLKILKWALLGSLLIGSLAVAGFVIYLETSFNRAVSLEQQEHMFRIFDEQPELPDYFIETINKYYPNYFQTGLWESVLRQILTHKNDGCPCREIYLHPGIVNWKPIRFKRYIVLLEIEERYSQQRCYEIKMALNHFGNDVNGAYEASEFYFGKELNALDEREILKMHLMRSATLRRRTLYFEDRLDKVIDDLIIEVEQTK